MIIYDKTNKQILDIPVDDTSYRYRSIMGQHSVTLQYSLTDYVGLPVGSYIDYQGERYTLWLPQNFKKEGTRNFEYTVEFGSNQEILNKYKYKNTSARPYKLKFSLTAKPQMFIQLLVDNLNLYDSGWKVGKCIEATEKVISFNHEYCSSVLSKLAEEFSTEFEITGKTINFCKVEKFKDNPLALSYGKGNGFKTGVGCTNEGDKAPVTVLYVQGGDRNIDFSTYKSETLLLPKSQELTYEGRRYKTDEYGMSITRAEKAPTNIEEDGFDASNIYPTREGTVTKVETEAGKDTDGNPVTFYNIIDTTIPEALNFRDCRIPGEKATIIFQTGKLTGREFDIVQTEKDLTGYTHATRCFKLVSLTEGKMSLPNTTLSPEVGDKYAVFHISLPDAYVCNDADKSGASWDMFREAVRYFREHEDDRFTFSGELDGMWAKKRWLEIGGKIVPGGYVRFSDDQFQTEGVLIRITGVKDYLNKPHSPSIELSNSPVAVPISNDLGKPDANEVITDNQHKDALSFTKRRWRDAVEGLSMLEAAIAGFSASINPITIQTMAMLIGDESLQFRFVSNKTNPAEIIPNFKYDQLAKVFTVPATILQHMTLGISKLSSSHTPNEYKYWNMSAYTSPPLDVVDAMYLYSKCSKSGATGSFLLSKTPYKMDPGDGYYYFLTGALSSEFEGERSFVTVYGFTEILPGRITVGMIVSPDGQTYFNVAQGEIGGKIIFKAGSSGLENVDGWSAAIKDIENAQNSATQAKKSVADLGNYVDGAFADGIIEESEAKAIEKYINTVNSSKTSVEATYNKLYVNPYLTGQAKSGLLNAKVSLFGAIDNLLWAIRNAIRDGRTTQSEKNDVDSNFNYFNTALASFYTAVETANKAIQDVIKEAYEAKDDIAKKLGYTSYADLNAKALAGETIINGGKISTTLIEAEVVVAKGITAEIIEALTIQTNKLTVLSGARIGNFIIEDGWLKTSSPSGSSAGYIDMTTGNTRIAFGEDLIPSSAGGSYTLTGMIENKANNKGGGLGMEYENVALRLSAKNADANWGLDCYGGIRRIGRSVEINEPLMIAGGADTIESKFRYYGHFMFQPPAGNNMIVRLPSSYMINNVFGTLPNGTPAALGMLTLTVTVQIGFKGEVTLVGVQGGQIFNTDGGKFDNGPISGYNYGTILLKQCDIVKLYHFNGGWFFHYFSRDIL